MTRPQFTIRGLLLVTLLCATAAADDRFLSSGERLSELEADRRSAEARTIDEWADRAFKARSSQFRKAAVVAINRIAARHTPAHPLSDGELNACREAAKRILSTTAPPRQNTGAFSEYREARVVAAETLALVADKGCIPIFSSLITKHTIYEPGLMGPAFRGLEQCGEDGRETLEKLAKSRDVAVRELASEALDRLGAARAP